MRVSLDVRHLALPGVGRFATELDRALGQRPPGDPDVVALLPRGAARGWLGAAAFSDPVATEAARTRSRPFGLIEQLEVPALLRARSVDLHHSTFLSVPMGSRVPIVLTVHDVFPLVHPEHARSGAARVYYGLTLPAAIRRATATAAVSDYTASEMVRVLGVEPDAVIGHGVDHGAWCAGTGDEDPFGREAPGGNGRPYVLYVGTAKPHKNLRVLLRAMAGAGPWPAGRAALPHLVLAGPTAGEVEALQAGVLGAGRVTALGRVRDAALPGLYRRATVLAMPSLYEGVGLAALEAMSFGVPVVAADSPGLRETVGDAALLAPAHDPAAWVDALDRLVGDTSLRSVLIERGKARAAAHTWADTAAAYVALYHSVLSR